MFDILFRPFKNILIKNSKIKTKREDILIRNSILKKLNLFLSYHVGDLKHFELQIVSHIRFYSKHKQYILVNTVMSRELCKLN